MEAREGGGLLNPVQVQFNAGGSAREVRLTFDSGSNVRSCFFRSEDILLKPRADALAAVALIPAMRSGSPLHLSGMLSGRIHQQLPRIQELYSRWHPGLAAVPVQSGADRNGAKNHGSRVGLFFSGGVDSFYTLLKHRDEITDLIFVHGFDIPVEQQELGDRVSCQLGEAAEKFGKRFVRIQTNLRGMLSGFGDWGRVTHGAALAAVAHLLPDAFGKIYISASYYQDYLTPWGSHPELDPLWSSDILSIEHDGCEARRFDKIQRISHDAVVMNFLRVCWKNKRGAYNCCQCEKCLRTMLDLQAVGVLPQCNAFDRPLNSAGIRRMKERYPGIIQDHLKHLPDVPENKAIRRALRFAERRNRIRRWIKQIFD